MGLFDPISAAESGVDVSQTWMSAISDNIANMNDVTSTSKGAYQPEFVVAAAVPGQADASSSGGTSDSSGAGGTEVQGVVLGSPAGVVEYDPTNPLADSKGMVRAANVDLGTQMTNMMLAQRGYEANLDTITQAEQVYQSALEMHI